MGNDDLLGNGGLLGNDDLLGNQQLLGQLQGKLQQPELDPNLVQQLRNEIAQQSQTHVDKSGVCMGKHDKIQNTGKYTDEECNIKASEEECLLGHPNSNDMWEHC